MITKAITLDRYAIIKALICSAFFMFFDDFSCLFGGV